MKRPLWVRISLVLVVVFVMQLVLAAGVSASAPANKPAAGGSGCWHLVRWGETLYSIGRRYGVSYWAIAQANGIANPNRIYAGQRLWVPYRPPCPPYPPCPGPRVYIVRCGDTLSAIACRFGTSVWAICRANHIWNANYIYVGQRLIIPDC